MYDPVNAEFVFIAIAIRRTGALSELFSRMNWFYVTEMIKLFASLQLVELHRDICKHLHSFS